MLSNGGHDSVPRLLLKEDFYSAVSKRVSKINCQTVLILVRRLRLVKDQCWCRRMAANWCSNFDGNTNLKDKVTYTKMIQKHLEKVSQRKFAFRTVVQLCVARNKHHRSCKRYKGLAQVTSRRARKGFNIRYNPDSHWS